MNNDYYREQNVCICLSEGHSARKNLVPAISNLTVLIWKTYWASCSASLKKIGWLNKCRK